MAIPTGGGPPHIVCESDCNPIWSSNGNFLFVPVEAATRTSPGRSLAIPVGPGESLPQLAPQGIPPQANASIIPGAQSVARADLVPGRDPSHYAYVNMTVHRNLSIFAAVKPCWVGPTNLCAYLDNRDHRNMYRISLP
ncbi:MAG TPA: hypothetical protein VHZ55_05985 [Bryobacteraceae bacterium]|nr:hypothetical protein [Bryobacteraceae bacterium]